MKLDEFLGGRKYKKESKYISKTIEGWRPIEGWREGLYCVVTDDAGCARCCGELV